MRTTEFVNVFMSEKLLNQDVIEQNHISRFKSGFICQHRKTILKIKF